MNAIVRKTLTAGIAALTLGAAITASVSPASAGGWGHGHGGGLVAAGIFGGLALGAMAAASANQSYAPRPVYADSCWMERRAVTNRFGDIVGYRRIRVCE